MSLYNVAIIGGGRLGSAIAKGLIRNSYPKEKLTIIQRNLEKGKLLQQEGFQVITATPNYANFDMMIIAVRPRDLSEVLRSINSNGAKNTTVISAVSGVNREALLTILNNRLPLFRAKFSIFVEVKQEIIPLFLCNPRANEKVNEVKRFLSLLGTPHIMPEAIMEMSGWELTSLPGIIFAQLIKERLHPIGSENAQLTEKFILSGLKSMIFYLVRP
jgi:pyrroline-5-carboxylate reductase